ncbi:class I SAM-dependent methyltransferase [Nitrososphaera viennensis]|uniref:Class I SAM-dependent methyltransferase n=2 Tax=Nitrososphaera viennensis TaxID=1034015 RepID=A0A977IBL2_9ARCH|nr:class I SAM-dependent methyltransferase [Nitrososphaera viennensis]UVS67900.1 class I SAM-dependent methyltransferase [Nitrososphaera viennensis]
MFTNAYAYDQFMGRWSRLLAPCLAQFAEIPDCGGKILDAGCGIGALAFAIAEFRPLCHIVGIDTSKEYIIYAESRNNYSDRVHFKVGDIQDLAFPDAAFDNSLSMLVLNFIPNAPRALSEMRRVTRPGGQVVAAVWDYGDGMEMLRAFWDAAVAVDANASRLHERHMPLCRAGELSGLWKSAALENIHEQPLEVEMNFKSFQDYWEPFLMGQGPAGAYVKHIGHDRLPILREEVKRQLRLRDETAPFILHGRVWAVRGSVPESRNDGN